MNARRQAVLIKNKDLYKDLKKQFKDDDLKKKLLVQNMMKNREIMNKEKEIEMKETYSTNRTVHKKPSVKTSKPNLYKKLLNFKKNTGKKLDLDKISFLKKVFRIKLEETNILALDDDEYREYLDSLTKTSETAESACEEDVAVLRAAKKAASLHPMNVKFNKAFVKGQTLSKNIKLKFSGRDFTESLVDRYFKKDKEMWDIREDFDKFRDGNSSMKEVDNIYLTDDCRMLSKRTDRFSDVRPSTVLKFRKNIKKHIREDFELYDAKGQREETQRTENGVPVVDPTNQSSMKRVKNMMKYKLGKM